MQFTKFMATALIAVTSAAPCPEPDQPEPSCTNVLDLAASREDLSTFVDAFTASALTPENVTGKELTFFVPTNDAFKTIDSKVLGAIVADKEQVTNVLLNHVVSGSIELDAHSNKKLKSLLENELNVNGTTSVNNINISSANIPVCGGYVNLISDGVLVPPTCKSPLELAAGIDELSTFYSAVNKSGLSEATLNDTIIFAPTNEAFKQLPEDVLNTVLGDVNLLNNVLLNHVVKNAKKELKKGENYTTLAAQNVTFDNSFVNNTATACDAQVIVINKVLVPEPPSAECKNILDVATGNDNLTTFVTAFTTSGINASVLNQTTVFVPTNDAFAELGDVVTELLKPENREKLTNLLLNHLFLGQFINDEAQGDLVFESFLGEDLIINNETITGGEDSTNVTFFKKNIKTCDNVVNIINKVLVPDAPAPDAPAPDAHN